MTENVVEMDQTYAKDVKGMKEIETGLKLFRNAWSDVKLSDVEMWAAGDYVIQMRKFEGKHTGDLGSQA